MADTTNQNPFASAFTPTAGASVSVPPPQAENPFASAFQQPTASVPEVSSSSSNPFASAFGSSNLENGQTAEGQNQAPQFDYQDPNKSWIQRTWSWANTPITESLFGLPETRPGAGGFERGLEKVVSGLTSPLSLALTAATFGTGSLIESAGATALKSTGEFAADEIPQLAKAAEAATQAGKDLAASPTAVEDAVRATGVNPARWKQAQDVLYNHGLTEHDLIGGNALENGAFQIIHHAVPDLPIASSVRAAKTANAVMNAGFTYQQLESAASMSPRFLDALKEGDYDKAKEYGVEALAGSALGIAGAGHAVHSWGELTEPILSTKLRPSDTTTAIQKVFGEKEAQHAVAEQTAVNIADQARSLLGHGPARPVLGDAPEVKAKKLQDLATTELGVHTGMDANKAAAWYNALSEAAGKEDKLPVTVRPENGLPQNIADQIANNKFKDQSPEYQNRVLTALKAIATDSVPDNVKSAVDYLREEQAKNYQIGGETGLIQSYVENHMRRVWKDQNPEGRVVAAQAKAGRFATSVSQARQRVYDSTLTGLLKSPVEMEMNPVDSTAEDRLNLLKAAANKQFLSTVMDNGYRDSTGRPVAFLAGSGRVVSGPDGEDPSIFIKPTNINLRKVNISDSDVQRMTQTGDLQRFLDDGTIRDITPYVRPNTIGAAIDRLTEQADRKEPQYDEEGNNILRQKIATLQKIQQTKDWNALKEFNDGQNKIYAWDPSGYVALAHDAVKGWNFVTNSPDGTPVFVHTDVLVSPEYADYFKRRLGLEESGIANNPIGKALLGAGTKLKETLLSLSPFHLVQEALRGIMVGINPFHTDAPDILSGPKVDPSDPNSPTKLYVGVRNGLNLGTNYRGLQDFSEGLSSGGGLLDKIPGIGKYIASSMGWMQDYLFKRYIPGLAARGYELMFDQYRQSHPDWSVDKAARVAAQHTNDTFGMLDYKKFGRSATTQDWARIFALAPSWLESEIRSGARLFNQDEGGLGRQQVLKMALGLWATARVLNMVTTGNPQLQAPFGLAVKNKDGKEIIFSIRTLPGDLAHAATDPVGFVKGRLSPALRAGQELVTQRDQFGRKMQPQDLFVDIFRNTFPIPLQAVGQAVSGTGPEVGNIGQLWKASGGTAMSYQTPAQKLAVELASNHSEDGPIDPALMHRHRVIMGFEDKIRDGELSMPDIYKMYAGGQLDQSDFKKITDNIKKTRDMSADLASLYTRASRLPGPEYLKVYDMLNPSEKAALMPLTLQVRKRYIAKAMKNMRPEERMKDPTFVRFLNMAPEQSPF